MAKTFRPNRILIDTGIVLALADRSDAWHQRALSFFKTYKGKVLVPSTIIPEVCYMLHNYLGPEAEIAFVESIVRSELFIEPVTVEDLKRSLEIVKSYRSLNIGMVDASVLALAERLDLSKLLTTDRWHFSVVKTNQGRPLELLP